MTSEILQASISLVIVLALILLLAYFYKKLYWQKISKQELIQTIAISPIGLKEKIVLVQCNNQNFLLGITTHQITLLHTFPPEELAKK